MCFIHCSLAEDHPEHTPLQKKCLFSMVGRPHSMNISPMVGGYFIGHRVSVVEYKTSLKINYTSIYYRWIIGIQY